MPQHGRWLQPGTGQVSLEVISSKLSYALKWYRTNNDDDDDDIMTKQLTN